MSYTKKRISAGFLIKAIVERIDRLTNTDKTFCIIKHMESLSLPISWSIFSWGLSHHSVFTTISME